MALTLGVYFAMVPTVNLFIPFKCMSRVLREISSIHFGIFSSYVLCAGFPHVLESPGFFSCKFQDLESPGKSLWSWKVLEIKA